MIRKGSPAPLGASPDADGTNFALYSAGATQVEVCLFDAEGRETSRHMLPDCSDHVWHGYLPGCRAGQLYGYRVHGDYKPEAGLRFNPNKLLIDPYARQLQGDLRWSSEVFDFLPGSRDGELRLNPADSSPFVPKSVVLAAQPAAETRRPGTAWSDTIIYETNLRGFTMNHPALPKADRGRFTGLSNGEVLKYLKALGITAIELMPVQAFIDEQALHLRGLRNLWGYNTINFFAPAMRYSGADGISEFRSMVDAMHDTGIEVILDIAYNHTGESDELGPSLCFRGIDNLSYYRTLPDDPGTYINDTGCGNTIDADQIVVQQLVIDSLRHWAVNMGVDGFRFDLATVLGRSATGFSAAHPLLQAISTDPLLKNKKLIAEPWDPGPGGYQLGRFPAGWSEWNDQFRDTVRRFWRGDSHQTGELAKRLHGSADIFEQTGRAPWASTNFVSSHDGFPLADVVSYERRHNEANGENNQDGHRHNYSHNCGVEGKTSAPEILAVRRRYRLNMLATLLLAQGTPMLLAGDELGNSQQGNNNAYAQDNPVGWIDWSAAETDPEFLDSVRQLIRLRRSTALLRQPMYRHGHTKNSAGHPDILWCNPDGTAMSANDWHSANAFCLIFTATGQFSPPAVRAVALLINASESEVLFDPAIPGSSASWDVVFASGSYRQESAALRISPMSLILLFN
jgi:glycogen operon protein